MRISDVARHAGVSPSTVSYVLSGKRSISPATRRRVLDSIDVLGYQPHAGARALASNRSNVIALVVPLRPGIHVPVAMQFAVSVVTSARDREHDVLLLTQAEGEGGLRRVAGTSMVDGIIVMDVEVDDARIPTLRSLSHPSVLIGVPAETEGLTCVDLDFEAAGRACAAHLAALGHREIALIGQPPSVYERRTGFAERTVAGFRAEAHERGIGSAVVPCDAAPTAVAAAVTGLLGERPGVTGLVVHNEPAVAPLLDAVRGLGREVPADISVVAIAPDDVATETSPPLTSVSLPAEEVGGRAVSLLMDKLDDLGPPEVTLLPPRLVPRASAAARPALP
ncbi:LacI family DNA-binding transcriptional regulator [Streptomonospora wellingtoniae]|uniref:LacI family DNA-binding transcriptional regulator n=1 Tax=Streptomonospora wellingtoniae TaxID=3075544 RepID=A0ABU2KV64_9ACTN|nr:LacI family DNA-binding transcriptional regulator [Streptomonospora sp. DSM 45055]MDT0303179.1 LacI family DNA-binding transcriptional regulator [Streptomonospora sp. DSM 45055]